MDTVKEKTTVLDLGNSFVQQHAVLMNDKREAISIDEWIEAKYKIAVPIFVDDIAMGTLFYASRQGGRKGIVIGLTNILVGCTSYVRRGHSLSLFNRTGAPSMRTHYDNVSDKDRADIKETMAAIVGTGITG